MAKQKNRTRLVKTLLEFSEKKTGQKRLKTKRIKSRYQLDAEDLRYQLDAEDCA